MPSGSSGDCDVAPNKQQYHALKDDDVNYLVLDDRIEHGILRSFSLDGSGDPDGRNCSPQRQSSRCVQERISV